MGVRHALGTVFVVVALAGTPGRARAELEPIPYTVARGDTAHRIAYRHGLTLAELRALNGGRPLERLRCGQDLVIGHGTRIQHRLRGRETLPMVAERYGVSVTELLNWNPSLDATRSAPEGHELVLWARRDVPVSQSIGRPDAGELAHGVRIPAHPAYLVRNPERAWVARHVAEWLARGFDAVLELEPRAARLQIRDASLENGGSMREHRSHQSGRDVDLAYYQRSCRNGTSCLRRTIGPDRLDARVQWALLERWLRDGAVEYIFIDHALQEPLWHAALEAGATRRELARWFQWPRPPHARIGVIRHVPHHADHLHVRFACATQDVHCVSTSRDND